MSTSHITTLEQLVSQGGCNNPQAVFDALSWFAGLLNDPDVRLDTNMQSVNAREIETLLKNTKKPSLWKATMSNKKDWEPYTIVAVLQVVKNYTLMKAQQAKQNSQTTVTGLAGGPIDSSLFLNDSSDSSLSFPA